MAVFCSKFVYNQHTDIETSFLSISLVFQHIVHHSQIAGSLSQVDASVGGRKKQGFVAVLLDAVTVSGL